MTLAKFRLVPTRLKIVKFWSRVGLVKFGQILIGVDSAKFKWISVGLDSPKNVQILVRSDLVKYCCIRPIFGRRLRGQVRQLWVTINLVIWSNFVQGWLEKIRLEKIWLNLCKSWLGQISVRPILSKFGRISFRTGSTKCSQILVATDSTKIEKFCAGLT